MFQDTKTYLRKQCVNSSIIMIKYTNCYIRTHINYVWNWIWLYLFNFFEKKNKYIYFCQLFHLTKYYIFFLCAKVT